MSAIGLLPQRKPKPIISAHADWRPEDFVFARTQSSALRNMKWEKRLPPLQSWDRLVYTGIGFALAALTALELLR